MLVTIEEVLALGPAVYGNLTSKGFQIHDWLPLISFNDPSKVWKHEPTFLIAELLFIGLLVLCTGVSLVRSRKYSLLWMAALGSGASIELINLFALEVGNFYHSQATFMLLGQREPFYMLFGCYIWIQWVAVALAWHMNLNAFAEGCMAALLGGYMWGILDTIGAKFLWWTWHSSEPMYAERDWGVPIASTYWISAMCGALPFAMRCCPMRAPLLPSMAIACVLGVISSLIFMTVPFTIIYTPMVVGFELPAAYALHVFRIVCVGAVAKACVSKPRKTVFDWTLLVQVAGYLVLMAVPCVWFDPTLVVRTSFSQPFGACTETETSFWGIFQRGSNVCSTNIVNSRDHFDFHCTKTPASSREPSEWYTVCGTPIETGWANDLLWHFAIIGTLVASTQLFTIAGGDRKKMA